MFGLLTGEDLTTGWRYDIELSVLPEYNSHLRTQLDMIRAIFLVELSLITFTRLLLSQSYSPPPASASVIAPIRFDSAKPLDPELHKRFQGCDDRDQCDGKALKYKCSNDPNRNSVFLKLADGTIFYNAKMAVDADGAEFTKTTPGMTDQAETSFRYPRTSNSLDADKVPYVVVPNPEFEKPLGIQLGDIAAVVYRDKIAFAIVGDHGPKCKIGEGSIHLHKILGQKGCKKRDQNGVCKAAAGDSIERDVLYFIFPGSKAKIIDRITPENINVRLTIEGQKLWDALRSAYRR